MMSHNTRMQIFGYLVLLNKPFKNISLHIRMNEAIGIVSIIKQIRKKSGTQNRELF